MIPTNNNPLSRLNSILLEIINFKGSSPYTALSSIFDLPLDNKGSILARYSDLYILCENSRLLINNIPNINHNKLLNPINDAVLALSTINFNSNLGLNNLKDCLTDKLISNLEICSEMISVSYKEEILEDSILVELSNSICCLRDSLSNYTINNELKNILLLHLNDFDSSIKKYKLYGISGIKSSLSNSLGDIILNEDLIVTEDEKASAKLFFEFVTNTNSIISLAKNIPTLITGIMGFLS